MEWNGLEWNRMAQNEMEWNGISVVSGTTSPSSSMGNSKSRNIY